VRAKYLLIGLYQKSEACVSKSTSVSVDTNSMEKLIDTSSFNDVGIYHTKGWRSHS